MNPTQEMKRGRARPKRPRLAGHSNPPEQVLAQLRADRENHLRELERLKASLADLPEASIEEADPAITEQVQARAQIVRIEEHLREIDKAIQVAQGPNYGLCEKCGQPIDPERLRVLPETRLCVRCKRESEKFKVHHTW